MKLIQIYKTQVPEIVKYTQMDWVPQEKNNAQMPFLFFYFLICMEALIYDQKTNGGSTLTIID